MAEVYLLYKPDCVELSRSRKLAVYRIAVHRDDGALVASLTGTVYRTGKPLPGEA